MKIYHYHPDYCYFLSEDVADPSPLELDAWLIPAHATTVEPPNCDSGSIQVFDGSSWSIIEDKRGSYYDIDTQEEIINYNPIQVPENMTKDVPPEVPEGKILKWNNEWILEDILPPPELTSQEKLESLGLTIEDLRTLLGLTP